MVLFDYYFGPFVLYSGRTKQRHASSGLVDAAKLGGG